MNDSTLPDSLPRVERPTLYDPSSPAAQITIEDLFGNRFRGAVVQIDYELRTRSPRQMYKRDFVYLSRLLHSLDTYREIPIIDQTYLDDKEASVTKKIDAVKKLIGNKLREANALIAANAQKAYAIAHAKAIVCRAPIVSPYAREYMEILVDADKLYSQLDAAYMLGLITRPDKGRIESMVRQAIRSIAQVVRQARVESVKHLASLRGAAQDAGTAEAIKAIAGTDAATLAHEGAVDADVLGSVSSEAGLAAIAAGASPLPHANEIEAGTGHGAPGQAKGDAVPEPAEAT